MFFLSKEYLFIIVFYEFSEYLLNHNYYLNLFIFLDNFLIFSPDFIDFKNTSLLRKFIGMQGKIFPKRINKVFKNQRSLASAL